MIRTMQWRSAHIFVLLSILLTCVLPLSAACAQDAPPPTDESTQSDQPEEVTTSDQSIGITSNVDDDRIAERIQQILTATERFTALDVQVREGVVFLKGTAPTEEGKKLAADLARKTEGVAAVVNNITLTQSPLWTLQPAKDEITRLVRALIRGLPLFVLGLIVLTVFALIAGGVSRAVERLSSRVTDSELLRGITRRAVFFLVLVFGVYIALRISGLTQIALTVVSGTGLIGLILGFAFRDIAENFLASILLSLQRPFRLGDVIEVDGHQGIVRKVTSRGTLLIDFDGNHIQIANATVYKNTIKNFSANPLMRTDFTVGIGYDDDIAAAQEVIRQTLDNHPAVLNDPEPLVLVTQLGASTVNLRIYFWIDGSKHSVLKVKSSTIRLIAAALTDAGISMPDEAREVIFPKGVPVRMVQPTTESESTSTRTQPHTQLPEDESAPQRQTGQPHRQPSAQNTTIATQAEGDLTTETHELEKQADEARDPEEGSNVLTEDNKT